MFTTDPAIVDDGLVELDDDRGLEPAENITPLVRSELVDRCGTDFVAVIDAVSARLTTAAVRELNAKARAPDADMAAVASAWWSEVKS
jgi:osmoprotectant transport system substrate-binding protein